MTAIPIEQSAALLLAHTTSTLHATSTLLVQR